jgi:hypothetical protein
MKKPAYKWIALSNTEAFFAALGAEPKRLHTNEFDLEELLGAGAVVVSPAAPVQA